MFTALRLATGLALSMAVATAPVAARDWHGGYGGGYGYHGGYHHDRGVGLGGVLLGAAIIGGVAAIASSNHRGRYASGYAPGYGGSGYSEPAYGYGQSSYDGGYDRGSGYDQRAGADPVEACSREIDRAAGERGDRARVTGIDDVRGYGGGSTVRGHVEIERNYGGAERRGFSCNANYNGEARVRFG